ncbi:LacI family DNA-binding transcriptional regulator [Nocardioides aequoreus]|uniref:LacI family DNA-binding transcriptional regulator n=1 Tax=Nocardioides aequoreus TaxID=397278 RepID=UPI0004C423A2|nr:LacI family DNA-binding transcriptional regulator [Nocardioides aequoreus]
MTGIKEVADEVGLSQATVSRALRGQRGVSERNRERIEEAAARLGYVASRTAVGLATGRTHLVAAVVPHVTRWYFGTVIHGAEQVLRKHGYDLLLFNLAGSAEARDRVLGTHAATKRADALLLAGLQPSDAERSWRDRHGTPAVLVGAVAEGWPSVTIDDEHVAVVAMQHLIDLGHQRIAYVGGEQANTLEFSTPGARHRGFLGSMDRAEHKVPPEYDHDGDFTLASGLEAGRALLRLPTPPTAIMCASDEMAIGVLRAARELHLAVPGDVSVIGVDDHELSEHVDLTTVRQPVEELGRLAATQLLQQLGELPGSPPLPSHVRLETELVVRGTTGPPPPLH